MLMYLRRVQTWFARHPHTLLSSVLGVGVGTALTIPLGWKLPDSVSALVGAAIGAAAAVAAALWAANAKQHQEDARADQRQRHMAMMVAAAIAPEIAGGSVNLKMIAGRLREAVATVDKGATVDHLVGILKGSVLVSQMCERFIDKLESFGPDANVIVQCIGAILDSNSSHVGLVLPVENVAWTEVRSVILSRADVADIYSTRLKESLMVLAKHHPDGYMIVRWV